MADWQKEWMIFGEKLQQHLSQGDTNALISRELAGRQVNWHGTLLKKDLDPNAPIVVFEMVPYCLHFGEEKQAPLPRLVIPLRGSAIEDWAEVPEGKMASFRAAFVETDYFLQPFELTTMRTGRITVTLRLVDAEFLGEGGSNENIG